MRESILIAKGSKTILNFLKIFISTLLLISALEAREKVNMTFDDLSIPDFIKLVSKITNKNILLNYKINGKINLVTTTPIYKDEVIPLLMSVLDTKGYTLVQNGSVYELVRSSDAVKFNLKVVSSWKKAKGAFMVTQSIVIKHENVDTIASKIRHLLSKSAKLVTMKESNTILISDYPSNVETIKSVIKTIESKNENIVRIVPVSYADIKQVYADVLEITKGIINSKIESQQVKMIKNAQTRSIILVGKKVNVDKIEALILRLDIEKDFTEVVKIIPLKNSSATKVLATMNQIVANQFYSDPALKPNISASEEINSLIIVGDPNSIKAIEKIVTELDKEKYQVYVQAQIIEINDKAAEKIGLQYGLSTGALTPSGIYALSADFGSSEITSTSTASILSYLGAIGSGAKSALALGATLDFLQNKGASQTVSTPSLLCVNNKESSIEVGSVIPVQTGSSTLSQGGTTNSYSRERIGLTLKIKPLVSGKDKVTLDVTATLENYLGTDPASNQPITSKQKVVTQTILRHGENIIIGGLVKSTSKETESKIPLLGDIPGIGALFRHSTEDTSQDNLLIILTPYVIDKSENLSVLQKQLGELKRLQGEYNAEIFPEIEKRAKRGMKENKNAMKMLNSGNGF
ncbi:MAG: hypothetical protein GQ570_03105 [Helicobacteraceae bacterium]|nr:hypothetical protein [Helicobacteraceae bacterium]